MVALIEIVSTVFVAIILNSGVMSQSPECNYQRDNYNASWTYNPTTQRVTFEISSKPHVTSGENFWTGIGFGSDMSDLDVYFIAVMRGRVATADSYTDGYAAPLQDDDGGAETTVIKRTIDNDGRINVVFSRPLTATHPTQDKSLSDCQTFQFPYSGGPIDGSRIYKHVSPPDHRLVCNLDRKCVLNAAEEPAFGNRVSKDEAALPNPEECSFQRNGYKVNWVSDGIKLNFVLTSPVVNENRFWIGMGFGENMQDLDIVVAKVADKNVVAIEDYYSQGYRTPKKDRLQNIEDASGEVVDGIVTMRFSRLLDTGDNGQDNSLLGCQTFQFATSGGRFTARGISKHTDTPIGKEYCDVGKKCLATNSGSRGTDENQPPTVPTTVARPTGGGGGRPTTKRGGNDNVVNEATDAKTSTLKKTELRSTIPPTTKVTAAATTTTKEAPTRTSRKQPPRTSGTVTSDTTEGTKQSTVGSGIEVSTSVFGESSSVPTTETDADLIGVVTKPTEGTAGGTSLSACIILQSGFLLQPLPMASVHDLRIFPELFKKSIY